MSTAHDVFRRLPIARTVRPILEANEREELKALLPQIPAGGVLLCDRGYPSYDLIDVVQRQYSGYWLFRGPAQSTFPAVEQFIGSGREQALITLQPPQGEAITVRAMRLHSPDGTLSVLLTNLLDAQRFPAAEPPLKHAIITVATILTPRCPRLAFVIFNELLTEIARVRYYPPKTPRPPPPRVARKPISKWQISKTKRLMNA